MRRFRMALVGLAAAAGLLIPAAAASAATPTPTQTVATIQSATGSCAGEVRATAHPPNYAHAKWLTNPCDAQGRVHIKCEFSNGSTHDYNGGWVRALRLNDKATCPSGSVLIRAAWQARLGPGFPVTTKWFWRRH